MSAPPISGGPLVTSKRQLIEWFETGCKPRDAWRIGTEHEKFVFQRRDLRTVPYQNENGIGALLEAMTRFGWQPVMENGNLIALRREAASLSLEPGGQFELSGAPLTTIHETCAEASEHLREMKEVTEVLGLGMLGVGFQPKWRRDETPWMPRERFHIMRNYMPKKGKLGSDMMLRTCAVQANLDFASEADMVRKFRVSLALQPLAIALFANSPFVEGKPSGYQSYRSHVWTDVDGDRVSGLPFVFEQGFGFERYTEWLLDVPMYFVYRDGKYIDAAGQSFRSFLAGRLPSLPGRLPMVGDWADHVTTVFPEVRLKPYLEVRAADAGSREQLCALPAFWVGLLYDSSSLDAAWDLVKNWTEEERIFLRDAVPRQALRTIFRGHPLRDLAREVVEIALGGLRRRARLDGNGEDERHFLDMLVGIVETDRTTADQLLDDFEDRWHGSVDPIFRDYAF